MLEKARGLVEMGKGTVRALCLITQLPVCSYICTSQGGLFAYVCALYTVLGALFHFRDDLQKPQFQFQLTHIICQLKITNCKYQREKNHRDKISNTSDFLTLTEVQFSKFPYTSPNEPSTMDKYSQVCELWGGGTFLSKTSISTKIYNTLECRFQLS